MELFKLGTDSCECFRHLLDLLFLEFIDAASRACCIVILIGLRSLAGRLGLRAVRRRMIFSVALKTLLPLPICLIERYLLFAITVSTTSLSKRRSFGVSWFGHSCLAVFVEEMQCLLTGFGIMVVTSGEIILQVYLEFGVLSTALT